METLQQHHSSPPEMFYNPAVSTNVSSYFVRPNKVVKSNSRNSSPRTSGRRQTMTAAAASSRTRSVVDHLRSSTQWQNTEMPRSRPLSWHPSSFEAVNSTTVNPVANEPDLSTWNYSTAQVHGLVTPISYPVMNEPQIPEAFTPLDELPSQDPALVYEDQSYLDNMWYGQGQTKSNSASVPLYPHQSLAQPTWGFDDQAIMAPNVQTAPSSPDSLPLQNFGLDTLSLGNKDSKSNDDSEELVGMGLYDSPAEVQSSCLLFGGSTASARKGLKLEESFEPVEKDDEEEEDADSEDAEEDEMNQQDAQQEAEDDVQPCNTSDTAEYEGQSIADHLIFGMQAQPDSLAMKYLSTLRQLNSAYYPSGHSYGWA
ncbi:hypothetical protein Z517_01698 [Fonsecaea pedrosoi CBS 271.37]|uniref:Uncharacterized protein n=1 Tax=Fonsecaea pedrosoi CBS 271.37 TaxID=1442368 RepID=A0A0D2FHY3_9EURO|nr:uncharacterized protein Z517_01698 [Fonsecaea pedrosoi CBS 271.37]KIW86302.1 hypothetical protein Z517_01698 [Fonsecaea pedrosoi CBS 271.37]